MLNRDFATTTANIAKTTNITPVEQINYANILDNFRSGYKQGQEQWEKQQLDTKKKAYIDALQSGDQEKIDNALADYNPEGYADVMTAREKRQQDLDDLQAKQDFQLKLMDLQNQRAIQLENLRHKNAMGLAQWKAQNGGGADGQPPLNPFDKKRIEKAASEMDANITRAQEMKATFEQANNALQNINTGTPFAMFTKNKPLLSNADEEAFDSAAAKSIDMVRKAGTGPMTDADARRYEKASIDRGKSKEANQLLIDSGMIAADNAIAREELRADWVANGGRLGDFDREWRNYLNSNPIFGKDGKINKSRQGAYDYFYGGQQPQQPSLKQFNSTDSNNDPLGLR